MPFSLHLPYLICYPATRLARWLVPPALPRAWKDQAAYFDYQYASTGHMRQRFLGGLSLEGAVVMDLGAGLGGRAPYWLKHGARRVLCVDVSRQELDAGRSILAAKFPELKSQVEFLHPDEVRDAEFADVGVLIDVFEHLTDPASVLRQWHQWLRTGGALWVVSIGWYHHLASHCYNHIPIPWSQVLFSERAIIRTIQRIIRDPMYAPYYWDRLQGLDRWDRVRTLRDRPGEPLNMLSLRAVRKVLQASPFDVARFEIHGYSGRRFSGARVFSPLAKIPVLRELFHSYYTATVVKPGGHGQPQVSSRSNP
jgi:SAM-dependent methyltransferase